MRVQIELSQKESYGLATAAKYRCGDRDINFVSEMICRLNDAAQLVVSVDGAGSTDIEANADSDRAATEL